MASSFSPQSRAIKFDSYFNSGLGNTATEIKSGAADLSFLHLVNTGASATYFQMFDLLAASVTLGTTPPKYSLWVPAGGAYDLPASHSLQFDTGLTVAATATATGNGAPVSNLIVNLSYR